MNLLIYLIAFLEGFTTLSVEIIAIREFTPIVGNNSIVTSIILGVILLALSYGYYIGGSKYKKESRAKVLGINLFLASLYYFLISFSINDFIVINLIKITDYYFLSILLSSVILFFIPVFLASQTIPLLTSFLKGNGKSNKVGKLLFFSTIGSFAGSVGTSMFLFPTIGVYKASIINSIILVLLSLIITFIFYKNNTLKKLNILFLIILLLIIFIDNKESEYIFEKSNSHQDIKIYDSYDNSRIFSLDNAYSSGIELETGRSNVNYINELENIVIKNKPKTVLVIGAAGFTFPNDISNLNFVDKIDVIDIDSSLKDISEKYFLNKELSNKINFYAEPSRYFLNKDIKYDLIFVDAYSGKSIPPQVLTQEFFQDLKEKGKEIYMNVILDENMESDFTKNLITTLNNVFTNIYYKKIATKSNLNLSNIILTNTNNNGYVLNAINYGKVYTDNKNSIELDYYKISYR